MSRAKAQKNVHELARDHRTVLRVWRPQLEVLRGEFEMVAERAKEAKQTLKELEKQTVGGDGSTLVDMVRLQESRIEEDMSRYMDVSYH